MKSIKSILMILLIMSITLTGCSSINNLFYKGNNDKPRGEIIESNSRNFIFEDTTYSILNETVSREDLSAQVGMIGKLVFIGNDFKAVRIEANLSYKDYLQKLTGDYPSEAYYFAQFENIYQMKDDTIVVGVDGKFYKTKPTKSVSAEDTFIEFQDLALEDDTEKSYFVNPEHGGQLIHNDVIYDIIEVVHAKADRGNLLQVIGTQVVFNTTTGEIIPKDEYNKMELTPGELSEQNRKSYVYGNVYELTGESEDICVLVEINHQLWEAKSQN
ncbi:NisI/SpaI family lantibiotic immunity lipoprotein [Clostridium sp. KNHs214]|uniref:NisI/SpaI family lantibiotic immunity lipoprotein n=1 Tax=Clostridium sp. KNHs214 TaxID=1540257 RepID=UPI0005550AA5|nr:NisI/SpaI family lantibiotic immunity lipoprotein [Clostridium sp. KNHs214]